MRHGPHDAQPRISVFRISLFALCIQEFERLALDTRAHNDPIDASVGLVCVKAPGQMLKSSYRLHEKPLYQVHHIGHGKRLNQPDQLPDSQLQGTI